MKQETIFQPNMLAKVQVLAAGATIPLDLPLNSFKEFLSPEAAINRYHANLKSKKNEGHAKHPENEATAGWKTSSLNQA